MSYVTVTYDEGYDAVVSSYAGELAAVLSYGYDEGSVFEASKSTADGVVS